MDVDTHNVAEATWRWKMTRNSRTALVLAGLLAASAPTAVRAQTSDSERALLGRVASGPTVGTVESVARSVDGEAALLNHAKASVRPAEASVQSGAEAPVDGARALLNGAPGSVPERPAASVFSTAANGGR
jgi:hypothetical protein